MHLTFFIHLNKIKITHFILFFPFFIEVVSKIHYYMLCGLFLDHEIHNIVHFKINLLGNG
jgi:hypothetical protein